jgi:hypothetical protein
VVQAARRRVRRRMIGRGFMWEVCSSEI